MGDSDKVGSRHRVPGLFSGLATAITAAAGLIGVLHETGYIGNRAALRPGLVARERAAQMRMRTEPEQMAAVDAPASASPELPAAASDDLKALAGPLRHRNLSGGWRDAGANCHQIKQVGRELTVTSYFADTGRRWAIGSGTVEGRTVSVRINDANPASLEADLFLSDDGRELSGMIKGVKGAHVARWRFVGPSCLQTAAQNAHLTSPVK